jgi:hypothetical protein
MTVIKSVRVIPSAQYDGDIDTLPTFDNTKLVAINTCPLWGIVRYTHHKTMGGMGRSMALEAGAAAHEVFAAHRLYSFMEYGSTFYGCSQESIAHTYAQAGTRIFGKERFAEMCGAVDPREDYRTRLQQFALTSLYNSGFYDDPGDKRRTTTNIEEMCIAYMDKHDFKSRLPYWDGKDFLGIEIPVDVVITITYVNDQGTTLDINIRFIGKADGIHYTDRDRETLRVHENKTASRLGDAWEMSWETNHQPTGYMIALSAMLGLSISQAEMLGTCLPLPKAYTINGLARVVVKRHTWQLAEWFQWLLHTTLLHEQFKDRPTDAPMYTHSCNRYFRPCSFIPLCATEPEERVNMFNDMAEDEWSPLHETEGTSDD